MSLPKLPNLDENFEANNKANKSESNKEDEASSNKEKRFKMPKSEYDVNNKPKLTIPDLDDVNLTDEIEKYLGEEGE